MSKFKVLESFELDGGQTEVGAVIELDEEKAEALLTDGKIEAVAEDAEAPAPADEAPAPEGDAPAPGEEPAPEPQG